MINIHSESHPLQLRLNHQGCSQMAKHINIKFYYCSSFLLLIIHFLICIKLLSHTLEVAFIFLLFILILLYC